MFDASQREYRQRTYRINCSVIHRSRRPPAPSTALPRLLILGVDGTLRRCKDPQQPYPLAASEWELMPQVPDVLGCYPLQVAGRGEMALGIVSNQDSVALGQIAADQAEQWLWDMIYHALGVRPMDVFFGHRLAAQAERTEPALTLMYCASPSPDDLLRLPNPGQLDLLLERHDVQPHEALLVGAQPDEATAAYLAGVPFLGAWDFFGWPDPPRPLLHGHRCDVCRRFLTLTCQCLDAGRYEVCGICQEGGV